MRRMAFLLTAMTLAGCGGAIDPTTQGAPSGTPEPPNSGSTPGTVTVGGGSSVGPTTPAPGSTRPAPDCASDLVPAPMPARAPTSSAADACASAPHLATPSTFDEMNAQLVGRWVACGSAGAFAPNGEAGLEIGGNGRYRFLERSDAGELTPSTGPHAAGAWKLYTPSQLNLEADDGAGGPTTFPSFSADASVVSFGPASGGVAQTFARVAASAANGADNLPPLSDGRCSMTGTWDVDSAVDGTNPATRSSFTFTDDGYWIGGEYGKDVCSTRFMHGSYFLREGLLGIVTGYGMGPQCDAAFASGYAITFDAGCMRATLSDVYDNCTGARHYLMIESKMVRRR